MIIRAIKLIVFGVGLLCVFASEPGASTCTNACHKTDPHKLNIHLVPHSHDDVGWLKTVDQYYYGSNKHLVTAGVQYIIDSVISELEKNPDRRFIYAESAFFWRWWESVDDKTKALVRKLVFERRLEFVLGGWCMSDEATAHYSAMIDQMTLGLKFLNDTFGECARPTVAWQIDPFGHSSEVAIEFAEMGFDGLFVGRIDNEDIANRKKSGSMEMVWRPDPSLGEAGDLFTSVLFRTYVAPPGFCFDASNSCQDDPIMDNKKLHGYNVDKKIKKFEELMKLYHKSYTTNHVFVTMGDDFMYSAASSWYVNIDKLIKYTNNASKSLHLLYSTPSCYLQAVNSIDTNWPIKESDDFFPYASDPHAYWTGYFTSRSTFKYYVYLANNILQATKKLATLLEGGELENEEFDFKNAVSTVQHHDGVSGTEQQHVTNDYGVYLEQGIQSGQKIFTQAYRKLYGYGYPEQVFGNLRNISQFDISEGDENFVITVHNQLPYTTSVPVRFPVRHTDYQIYHLTRSPIDHDIIQIMANLKTLPGRTSKAIYDMIFTAKNIPPLGVTNYYVQKSPSSTTTDIYGYQAFAESPSPDYVEGSPTTETDDVVLDNGQIQLIFNKTDGLLYSVTKNNVTYPFHQNFFFYTPFSGHNENPLDRASGAYVFRPTTNGSKILFQNATISEYRGKDVFEVHQRFSWWLSQVVRLYKNSDDIEFEWLVGPVPLIDFNGVEIITKYITNVASNSTFYTDSNGRRWMKRSRNFRKYWNTTSTEPVASNYYPVTTAMCIQDQANQVTVIVDRPEGCTSMKDGELEIMLHRRLLYDDAFGVGEPLDEHAFGKPLVVRGTHIVQINQRDAFPSPADAHRLKTAQTVYRPVVTFAGTNYSLAEWLVNFNKSFALLTAELPPNIHILTLERWRENQLLLRLEHLFQHNESSTYSHPLAINIREVFKHYHVTRYQELRLAANIEKYKKLNQMRWHHRRETPQVRRNYNIDNMDEPVTLEPMQIRTFLLFTKKSAQGIPPF